MEVLFSALLPSSLPIASSTSYKQLSWESWERREHSPAVAAPRGRTDRQHGLGACSDLGPNLFRRADPTGQGCEELGSVCAGPRSLEPTPPCQAVTSCER